MGKKKLTKKQIEELKTAIEKAEKEKARYRKAERNKVIERTIEEERLRFLYGD